MPTKKSKFKDSKTGEIFNSSDEETKDLNKLRNHHMNLIPKLGLGWNQHSIVTLRRQSISRILYYDWVYKKLLGKPGVICEFGVQWGATMSLLTALRGIYEPYNYTRKIFGFDTFEGFVGTSEKDTKTSKKGDYVVTKNYEETLEEILSIQDEQNPVSHIQKNHLIKGDASKTIKKWLKDYPGNVIGMAIFDMDVYDSTYDVLKLIKPRLFKGSILVFDEFNDDNWPGETQAVFDALEMNDLEMMHFPNQPNCAICIL